MQGSCLGSPLPSRTAIIAFRYHFHTEISRERELTFVTGAAAAYSEQHTMHHRWAVSRGEEKHEVCRLITPWKLMRGRSSFEGGSLGCPLSSGIKIIAVRYHFHTEISRERELTFVTGAAAVYSEQHTMHHRWAVSRGEEKHEVCRLITPSILIRGHSSFARK